MNLLSFVAALLPVAAAVSSCADLDGKDISLRVPWYGRNVFLHPRRYVWHRMRIATDTMQVRAGAPSQYMHHTK